MDRIFKDFETDCEFRANGFVILPLLGEDDVKTLLDLHTSLTPEVPEDFFLTVHNPDTGYRRQVYQGIADIVEDKIKVVLPHYKLVMALFFTKRANTQHGKVDLHQDMSSVDPTVHTQINIWCPLVDVGEQSGCLKVVKESHKLVRHISATPLKNPTPFEHVMDLVDSEFTTKVPLKAGWAIFFDGRMFHSSDDNMSGEMRIAFGGGLIPEAVPLRLYFWDEQVPSLLDIYEVPDDFFLDYLYRERPDHGRYLGSINYQVQFLTTEDLSSWPRHE